MADEQVLALRCEITPIDFDGTIEVQSSINGYPENQGYRGHIFWDTEIFILPFFTFTQPAIARNLLNYRYDTLPGARRKAEKLQLTPGHLLSFHKTIARMYIPYDSKTLPIEQFEGFFALQDLNLSNYEPRTKSIQTVLGMAVTNQSQVIKQPDVLMLLYLLFNTPEFANRQDILHENWNYYTPRTDSDYGSSLGSSVQALLAATLDKSIDAYQHFMQAAFIDLKNTFGNTEDGIHAASAGGIWQALVFGFGGIQLTENGPIATPHLPPHWTRLKFKLNWRGTWHNFDLFPR